MSQKLQTIIAPLVKAILILSFTVVSLLPLDYWRETMRVSQNQYEPISLFIFILFCTVFTILDLTKVFAKKIYIPVVLGIFLLVVNVNANYSVRKNGRISSLRILGIFPESGIQAQLVTIKGLYFGNNDLGGKVIFDGEPVYKILSWTDNVIVFEQPVPSGSGSDRFGSVDLYLTGSDGRQSNVVKYKILDPDTFITKGDKPDR